MGYLKAVREGFGRASISAIERSVANYLEGDFSVFRRHPDRVTGANGKGAISIIFRDDVDYHHLIETHNLPGYELGLQTLYEMLGMELHDNTPYKANDIGTFIVIDIDL
ncbi:MAG: hypothetical protein ISS93_01390 [Candidatus Aenigmarchaeota archaeon]|nr:hypothetical protein [Candidatus Aenigmarchaeota archaeon]